MEDLDPFHLNLIGVWALTMKEETAQTQAFNMSPTEEFYAPGSLGSFNLQLQVTVENNQNHNWAGNEYELVVMVMNSGVFVNERGTSSTFIGLLTKQDVLDALQQQPYSNNEVRKMVGGGFLDNIRSGLGWITSKLPAIRGVLEHVPHQYAQTGANVLKALG